MKHTRVHTISSRMILGFLICMLIPTTVLTVLFSLQHLKHYMDTADQQIEISTSLAAGSLESQFDRLDTITMAPYYNSYFSSLRSLDPNSKDYQAKYIAFQDEMRQLFNLTIFQVSGIDDLVIWSDGMTMYHIFYNELMLPKLLTDVTEQSWYTHALEGNGKMVFTPPDQTQETGESYRTSSVLISRQIRNLHNPGQINMVLLNLNTSSIASKLSGLNLMYHAFAVLTNEKNELVYSSHELSEEAFESILSGDDFRLDGNRWRESAAPIGEYGLTVHIVYSLSEVNASLLTFLLAAVLIYLAALIIVFILYRRNNRWIDHSVRSLLSTLSQIEAGDLTASCEALDVAEFNKIGESVNEMTAIINEKIKNEYLMELRQKSLQLYALQAQIQPHFINNTIYCLIALNQIGEKQSLNSSLYSLSHLLRYIMRKEKETSLGEECDFLEDYFKLQKLRFGDRLNYRFEISQDDRSIRVPRLLLQPLVENAILHGIEPCPHPCTCSVVCRREEDVYHISIEDDGVGLNAENGSPSPDLSAKDIAPADLLTMTREKTSIGLYYVRERLRLWSEQASMNIRSEDGLTISELYIPMEVIEYGSADRG